jgi:hypothetical protein
LRDRPRNILQDEVGGEGQQEKVYNTEEWKKLLRMVRNLRILLMPLE